MSEIDSWKNTLHHGDCLEIMKDIPDKSIDLFLVDSPYNIGKDKTWDTWKTQEAYISWCGDWILQGQRVLKNTGSFYFFHNDMLQIAQLLLWLQNNSDFVFRQFIIWNKRFDGVANRGYLDGFLEVNNLRNYQQMAEYCLFFTFQDGTGLDKIKLDVNNFVPLRQYFKSLQDWLQLSIKEINAIMGHRKAEHCFYWGSTQWLLPTKEVYDDLINKLHINKFVNFREYESLRLEYESLRLEYESLRLEYESLRFTFNNQKTHHSVWNYAIAPKMGHITPKPIEMIENIIRHSSNNDNIILDPFMGSGTTCLAAKNTGRNYIGIEKDEKYFNIAKERIAGFVEKKSIDTKKGFFK